MCVTADWLGRVSRQGTSGGRRASYAVTGPMVTAATVDASVVRSAGRYCLSPVVSWVRCLQAAVQATTRQFVRSGSARSALRLPLCRTAVVVSARVPAALPHSSALAGGRAGPAAGSPARLSAPDVCRTGCAGGAPGLPQGGRGVHARISGPARGTGCGVPATVPPRLRPVRPRRGAAVPSGPGG